MRKFFIGMGTFLLSVMTAFSVSAGGINPNTGETFNPVPLILAGVCLVVLLLLVALLVMEQKKKNTPPPPPPPETEDRDKEEP